MLTYTKGKHVSCGWILPLRSAKPLNILFLLSIKYKPWILFRVAFYSKLGSSMFANLEYKRIVITVCKHNGCLMKKDLQSFNRSYFLHHFLFPKTPFGLLQLFPSEYFLFGLNPLNFYPPALRKLVIPKIRVFNFSVFFFCFFSSIFQCFCFFLQFFSVFFSGNFYCHLCFKKITKFLLLDHRMHFLELSSVA